MRHALQGLGQHPDRLERDDGEDLVLYAVRTTAQRIWCGAELAGGS